MTALRWCRYDSNSNYIDEEIRLREGKWLATVLKASVWHSWVSEPHCFTPKLVSLITFLFICKSCAFSLVYFNTVTKISHYEKKSHYVKNVSVGRRGLQNFRIEGVTVIFSCKNSSLTKVSSNSCVYIVIKPGSCESNF